MRRNRTTLSIALKALLVLLAVSLVVPLAAHAAKEVIKIGVLLQLSGPLAYEGGEVLKGLEGVWAEQNEKGSLLGKQIEFVKGDAVDAKAAVSEAEHLINVEGVKIIIGTFWSVGAPLPFKGQTGSPIRAFAVVG